MRYLIFFLVEIFALPLAAQNSSFDEYHQQQKDEFGRYQAKYQAEFDAYRKHLNDQFAEYMRQAWEAYPVHDAEKPVEEKTIPPIVYEDSKPKPIEEPLPKEDIKPLSAPKPVIDIEPIPIAVKPVIVVVPPPAPTPEPIAPVQPKEEPYKKVSITFYGSIITIGFPIDDNLKVAALKENAIADAWNQLSGSRYDITVKTSLDIRNANRLCDWAYMKMLQAVTEKQYGQTYEAVLMQAFLMTQAGYRIRLGMDGKKLYMLVASNYDIFNMPYYIIEGIKFYNVCGAKNTSMYITKAKFDKECSLSLQMNQLPLLGNDQTQKRTLTSRKGVTSNACVNKNLIDFFNTYPQACISGNQSTRWAAYANTPVEQSVKDMLYPPLKKTISGMNEREAVEILLNWVQTAFEYGYDDQIWGSDKAFFVQETLYYPYSDCEDRAILFSRLVRDLVGLDIVLLYYPGHLATAVAFNDDVKGDYLTYKGRKYVVCDPTYINAGVGRTMPDMNNQEAQIIALK